MTTVYNRHEMLVLRRELRKKMTPAEKILWLALRRENFKCYRFRRQYSIDNYIVDFYCPDAKLVIEIDGGYHSEAEVKIRDAERQAQIESYGVKFLRFSNQQVLENLPEVIEKILINLK
jgi:very-short-patch-repair endonuclease